MRVLSCKETTRLVSQGLDRELAFGERVALRLHLAGSQMRTLRKAVRELAEIDLNAGF